MRGRNNILAVMKGNFQKQCSKSGGAGCIAEIGLKSLREGKKEQGRENLDYRKVTRSRNFCMEECGRSIVTETGLSRELTDSGRWQELKML